MHWFIEKSMRISHLNSKKIYLKVCNNDISEGVMDHIIQPYDFWHMDYIISIFLN